MDQMNNTPVEKTADSKSEVKNRIIKLILALLAGLVIGTVFAVIAYIFCGVMTRVIPALRTDGSWSDYNDFIPNLLVFSALFWGLVLGLKIVTGMTVREFILGRDRKEKINLKTEVLPLIGLSALGILITLPFSLPNILSTGKTPAKIIFMILFTTAFAWMQISWEELVFRGFPLRVVCGDKIRLNAASLITAVVTSTIFMLAHLQNTEVTSVAGGQKVFVIIGYFIAGFGFFLCDILGESLLPGLVLHWTNNMIAFIFISTGPTTVDVPSFFVDTSSTSGFLSFLTNLTMFAPVVIYLIIMRKRKKAAIEHRSALDSVSCCAQASIVCSGKQPPA